MKTPIRRHWRRLWLGLGLLMTLLALGLARPAIHIVRSFWNDREDRPSLPAGTMDDASRLNSTKVRECWRVPEDASIAESQLASLLQRARAEGLKVAIAGARHSMGAHTITADGIVVDMLPFHHMSLDGARRVLRVQSGARWHDVIHFLNAHGLSVEIMQSNDDFSVGGSLSANCHGWQFGRPPMVSSVESFRLLLANGDIVTCSRKENAELFRLVPGGYGLFGIILDVELRVVPNERYRVERHIVTTSEYEVALANATHSGPEVAMVYGRLCVAKEGFLSQGIFTVLRREPAQPSLVTDLAKAGSTALPRAVFRGSVGDDYGKALRWWAEGNLEAWLMGEVVERNALMSHSAVWFENRSATSTDILLELFVPPGRLEPLLAEMRQLIPANRADLLNVTIRHVAEDADSFLRYADRDMIALVMLFNQEANLDGETRMRRMTQELIAAALAQGGRYYLPYRSHATRAQFAAAYPQAEEFFHLKHKYDPEGLFSNGFMQAYGR